MRPPLTAAPLLLALAPGFLRAGEPVDLDMMTRLRDEEFHVAFDRAGLPGFQLIQEEVDDRATTDFEVFGAHHTNMDTYDRLPREDLVQASVIMAALAGNAASRPDLLPRKPLPKP